MLGPAPVIDFDGTLADLQVPWDALRNELGVGQIVELWGRGDPDVWNRVTAVEVEAAEVARPLVRVRGLVESASSVAVLSNNSETAVRRFLDRFPSLRSRVALVVGRETLAGPKTDFEVFTRGFRRCVEATAEARDAGAVVYLGDAAYELEFARRLGAKALDTADVDAGP